VDVYKRRGRKKGKILLNITNKSKIRDLKMKEDWLVLSHSNFSTFSFPIDFSREFSLLVIDMKKRDNAV
jgi:hypothetical protein